MKKTQIISSGNHFYYHTIHSYMRACQRGISNDDIMFVINNSKAIYRQNFRFYSLKNSHHIADTKRKENLINMIVVTDSFEETIITAYKSESGWKKIKRKSKRLYKNKYSA